MVAVSGAARIMPIVIHVGDTTIGNGNVKLMKFINNIINFWTTTWAESKLMFFLEAIGAISSIIAASHLAIAVDPNLWWVFIFYIIGSSCLLVICFLRNAEWMLIMFLCFTGLNAYGLVNHF